MNIFLPIEMAAEIHRAAHLTAFAMKNTYGCEGISTRQHNEPAGNQDVWHYHLHVYPRYKNDNLYLTKGFIPNQMNVLSMQKSYVYDYRRTQLLF